MLIKNITGNILKKREAIIGLALLVIVLHSISFNNYILLESSVIYSNILTPNSAINDNLILSSKSEKLITYNNYEDNQPAIAVDSNDVIHLVWFAYDFSRAKNDIFYANSSDNFLNKIRISDLSTNDDNPTIAIDSSDIVHIAWDGSDKIYYTNSSTNYSLHLNISNQGSVDNPQLYCESSGIVHLVWSGYQAGNWDVYYANSSDLFSHNEPISKTVSDDQYPDLCVHNSIVHIVWSKRISTYEYEIAYSNSTDFFGNEMTIFQEEYSEYIPKIAEPRITVDNSGNLHIVWDGEKSMQYDTETFLFYLLIDLILDNYNDVPFVPFRFRYNFFPFYFPSFSFHPDYHIFYTNSISNFKTQIDISDSVTDEAYSPDIVVDSNNITHIIWWGYTETTYYESYDSRLFYTNSSLNFRNIRMYSRGDLNKHPRIANDSANEIHCVFVSYYNSYDIFYLNTTEFSVWTTSEVNIWNLMQIAIAIPNMPDMSILTVVMLSALGGFNFVAILIFASRKREVSYEKLEKVPKKPEEKEDNEFSKKKRGKKLIVKKRDKKIKVNLP